MKITGAEILAKALKRQKVEAFFFLMGGPMTGSEGAIIDEGIRGIDVRHEQAAAMMAHAYSRVRNTPGVCIAASGPGTTNLVTGVVGRKTQVATLRAHPLMRAVRPDKLTIAALVATLEQYRDGVAPGTLPVWRMIGAGVADLARRAEAIAARLRASGCEATVIETTSTVGGGALPEETQPSRAVAIAGGRGPNALARRLRAAEPPVIARIVDDRLALDLRSVLPEDDDQLVRAVAAALTNR